MIQLKWRFLLACLALSLFYSPTKAQILSRGIGISFGMVQLPDALRFDNSGTTPIIIEDSMYRKAGTAPTIGLNMPFQFRLLRMGSEQSIGLNANPGIGAFIGPKPTNNYGGSMSLGDSYGLPFYVSMPVTLQYMRGNFSTGESEADRGFAIGLGAEYAYLHDKWLSEVHPYYTNNAVSLSGIRPAMSFHYRWWTRASDLAEMQLLISNFGYLRDGVSANSLFAKLSFNFFLNY